jgi:hypothetical protein
MLQHRAQRIDPFLGFHRIVIVKDAHGFPPSSVPFVESME